MINTHLSEFFFFFWVNEGSGSWESDWRWSWKDQAWSWRVFVLCQRVWTWLKEQESQWKLVSKRDRVALKSWKCQVCLFLFFSSCLMATEIWSNGPKGVGQQASYSSVQLKQTDLLLVQHPQRSPPHPVDPLGFPFLHFFLIMPRWNRACTHHQSMKGNANGHMLKADWQF